MSEIGRYAFEGVIQDAKEHLDGKGKAHSEESIRQLIGEIFEQDDNRNSAKPSKVPRLYQSSEQPEPEPVAHPTAVLPPRRLALRLRLKRMKADLVFRARIWKFFNEEMHPDCLIGEHGADNYLKANLFMTGLINESEKLWGPYMNELFKPINVTDL